MELETRLCNRNYVELETRACNKNYVELETRICNRNYVELETRACNRNSFEPLRIKLLNCRICRSKKNSLQVQINGTVFYETRKQRF